MNLDVLFQQVSEAVGAQQEQDQWERRAEQSFDRLVKALFDEIKSLLSPLEERLREYDKESIERIWTVEESGECLSIRFKSKELLFQPIGADTKQEGDRYTIQILRQNKQLVTRFELTSQPFQQPQFCVLRGSSPEAVSITHLITLLLDELMVG